MQLPRTSSCLCVLIAASLVLCSTRGSAQAYDAAVGLRLGRASGVSYAQRIAKRISLEAQLAAGVFDDGFTVAVLGRRHLPILGNRVNLFVGGGMHKGWGYTEQRAGEAAERTGNPFGLDGQVGAELALKRTNIAFDYSLQINLSGELNTFRPPGAALTLRYVINKRTPNVKLRYPWESADEAKARRKARDRRKKDRARQKRKEARQDGKS